MSNGLFISQFDIFSIWYFQFDNRKLGDTEISSVSYAKLEQDLNDFQTSLSSILQMYAFCLGNYTNLMQGSLDTVKYYRQDELMKIHLNMKNQSMIQVWKRISINRSCTFNFMWYCEFWTVFERRTD